MSLIQKSKKPQKKVQKIKPIRLTSNVVPSHYTVTLQPDLEARSFSGFETIDLTILKKTKEITLHAKELYVFDVLCLQQKKEYTPIEIAYDEKHESATFYFDKNLEVGKAKIRLSFQGVLLENMRGLYASKYYVDGKEHIMATTQFEANDARRCIPCFDEPSMKATFQVSLIILDNKDAVSNMLPLSTKKHSDGFKIISFDKTPKMSTYLLAFLVGDFEYLEQKTKKGVLVRIITTPGKKEQGRFALDVTLRCLEFYETYFGIAYPLNTLDMIAVPDFESGAMENWGAITYRETALLIDEEFSSLSNRQRVAIVICHELAHQWFGNLVTMEWWNDLWLNEGFASYMEYVAVDALFPEWNIWSHFMFSDHDRALRLDAMTSTHPIDVTVHDPNDIGQIFDAISYSKGASVIRQLASYLGEDIFRKGLTYYLKKHSYKNTETIHLWQAFEKQSSRFKNKEIEHMMDVWTKKPGYPVLSVSQKEGVITLSQNRFFILPGQKKDTTLWPVPVSLVDSTGETESYLMTTKQVSIHTDALSWVKVNSRETGFYRVSYSTDMLQAFKKPIQEGRLSEEDRYGIVRDVISQLATGQKSITEILDFIDCYKAEQTYSIWSEIVSLFLRLQKVTKGTTTEEKVNTYVRDFMKPIFLDVGYSKQTNEEEGRTLLRSLVLHTLISFDDTKVISWAKKTAVQKNIDKDLRSVAYAGLAKNGTQKEYMYLKKKYTETAVHQEKSRILSVLGSFENSSLLEKNTQFLFSKDVRLQDSIYLFMSMCSFKEGRIASMSYMKKEWTTFKDIAAARNMFSDFVRSFSGFETEKDKKTVQEFFTKKGTEGIEHALAQTLEKIDQNIFWNQTHKKDIEKYFSKK